ncbi:hypothetical protein HZH66_011471 [Vespula vulgaris]|uniref:Uncharacterized protein n=1 Tax=Vespula vulgaris TaxID=7454 RepID=A0A834MX85_VESVU|nr:hypothetical protein HZH66_011471 [Vespula vulgaris]
MEWSIISSQEQTTTSISVNVVKGAYSNNYCKHVVGRDGTPDLALLHFAIGVINQSNRTCIELGLYSCN